MHASRSALFLTVFLTTSAVLAQGSEPQAESAKPGEQTPASKAADEPAAEKPQTTVEEQIEVTSRASDLVGVADSASEGAVGRDDLAQRPLLRPGELLETVPGVVITQHSGGGKANQYFLRGFNLDHGTDFRIVVAGIPVNMPTHAHGQGYSDLNFLIPELVETVRFRKGPYAAEDGDFSAAG
jgi:outer membrane cobalamin receptor